MCEQTEQIFVFVYVFQQVQGNPLRHGLPRIVSIVSNGRSHAKIKHTSGNELGMVVEGLSQQYTENHYGDGSSEEAQESVARSERNA